MSAITTPLKNAIKMLGAEAKIINGLMVVTGDIGLSHYPIFDEAYRPLLNGKIVRHYWNREIGVETPDLFKFNLETDMAEFMPYFNQVYDSTKLEFDPFSTIDMKTMSTAERSQDTSSEAESASTTDSTSQSRAVNSNTPQTQLKRDGDYATAGADSKGWGTNEGTGTETAAAKLEENGATDSQTMGYQGLTSEMLMRFRDTFVNIDRSVIESLSDNFMLITNSGSRYTDSYTYERYGI